jgi:lipopolysaccharide transport system permease protein
MPPTGVPRRRTEQVRQFGPSFDLILFPLSVMNRSPFRDNLRLAWDLARRDLAAKYKRSIVGPLWLVLTPLCLLGIYWLVFGVMLGVQWKVPHRPEEGIGFLLPFFTGLVVYLTVSDLVNSSSALFASKRTYVVKSPFPIWVLWLANLLRGGVHAGVMLGLLLAVALLQHRLTWSGLAWLLPALAICGLFICGLSLLLAALGPFIGDISEAMRLMMRILFYATPITYPLTLVPEALRGWLWFNPLTAMVEVLRAPLVFGSMPEPVLLIGFSLVGAGLLLLSAFVFSRVKGVISDVV